MCWLCWFWLVAAIANGAVCGVLGMWLGSVFERQKWLEKFDDWGT